MVRLYQRTRFNVNVKKWFNDWKRLVKQGAVVVKLGLEIEAYGIEKKYCWLTLFQPNYIILMLNKYSIEDSKLI